MTTTRVAVLGAGGRMGRAACEAVEAADDLELVARVGRGDDVAAALARGRAQVAVELSVPDAAPGNVAACLDAGVHVVVGTSGWDEQRLAAVRDRLDGGGLGVLVAPNFALGAVLMMRLAEIAAPWFTSVEVVELHHPDKADAPSGTARRTAGIVAAARERAGVPPSPDATRSAADGARGADVDGVRVHSVRLRGLVAHQEVLLGNAGEQLTIRHDSLDRASFMPGVLLGIRRVADHPGLTVGLEHYLDLG